MCYIQMIKYSMKLKLKDYKQLFLMTFFPVLLTAMFAFVFTEAYQNNGGTFEGQEKEIQALEAVVGAHFQPGQEMIVPLDVSAVVESKVVDKVVTKDVVTDMIIAMLFFALLMGGQFGVEQVFYLNEPVGKRLATAPLRRIGIYLSELMACWCTNLGAALIVVIMFEVLFKLGLQQDILGILCVVAGTTLMATMIGTMVGICTKTKAMGESVYSFILVMMVMLGGQLIPQADFGKIAYLSPIKAGTEAVKNIITFGKIQQPLYVVLSFGIIIGVGLGVMAWYMKKVGGNRYVSNCKTQSENVL